MTLLQIYLATCCNILLVQSSSPVMTPNEFRLRILPIQDKLFRFAFRMVGYRKDAEDVIQDVLVKLWNDRSKWGTVTNPEAWCMRMVRNQALDRMRSKQFQTHSLQPSAEDSFVEDNSYGQSELSDMVNHIHRLIDQLPLAQKQVIQLRDIEGYSYEEIATILELSLAQVKVYLFRARTSIRLGVTKIESYGTNK